MNASHGPAEGSDMLARILAAAARLFMARGYRGISMREIAEAVGISKAGLYFPFFFSTYPDVATTEVADLIVTVFFDGLGM